MDKSEATDEELSELEKFLEANPDITYAFSVIDAIKTTSPVKERFSDEETAGKISLSLIKPLWF